MKAEKKKQQHEKDRKKPFSEEPMKKQVAAGERADMRELP